MMANNPAVISENGKTQSPVSVKEACVFLSGYASALLGCGATCIRIEKNVNRMAETFGIDYSMVIMPATVQMTVWDMGQGQTAFVQQYPENPQVGHELQYQYAVEPPELGTA